MLYKFMADTSQREKIVEETTRMLRRVVIRTGSRMRADLAKFGLTGQQVFLLRLLTEKGIATPNALAKKTGVTPGNITGLIDKLEKAGLLTRSRDMNDRRLVRLHPTAKARREMKTLRAAAAESMAVVFDDWSTEDILRLKSLLERLASDLGASAIFGRRSEPPPK